jgi:hypothetical protein
VFFNISTIETNPKLKIMCTVRRQDKDEIDEYEDISLLKLPAHPNNPNIFLKGTEKNLYLTPELLTKIKILSSKNYFMN